MKIQAAKLAEIGEKSPGYSVLTDGGIELTDIQFERRNGRRYRAIVLMTYNGRVGRFDADSIVDILD